MESVHPHACGDDTSAARIPPAISGSPPRVWGRRDPPQRRRRQRRFTPTRVGTTWTTRWRRRSRTVHPHACGDDYSVTLAGSGYVGSPPRVWGRHHVAVGVRVGERFTPTRVGTTATPPEARRRNAVHPHACGDDGEPDHRLVAHHGSPPRVWGRPCDVSFAHGESRFTPTRVGTTTEGRK